MRRTTTWIGLASAWALTACGAGNSAGEPYPYSPPYSPADLGAPAQDAGALFVPDPTMPELGFSGFVEAAHDPFSTFAADVDTASYDIFARDVSNGALPSRATVRVEEFVNFFAYDYGAPELDGPVPFTVALRAGPHPLGRETTILRVGIQAADPPVFVKRPTNLVFLVDVSGSMGSPEKLPVVQTLLLAALEQLDGTDTVSIVTYAGSTRVALAPTPASNAAIIAAVIEDLVASGSTAGGAGIQLAYQQAEAGFIEGGFNHVFLCTDGDFNVGISDTNSLVALIEEKRESGVTLTALGFGTANNDEMMERVSNAGNGIYSVIASHTLAERYAEEALLRTVVHVARDMKIQVEMNPSHVLAYRLLGYENRAIADDDFRDDTVDAGEVGAGFRVTALYELVLAGGTIPTPDGAPPISAGTPVEGTREVDANDVVRVKVRYFALDDPSGVPAREVYAVVRPEDLSAIDPLVDLDTTFAVAIAGLAEVLRGSPFATLTELETIGTVVASQAARDRDRTELAGYFDLARGLLGGGAP